MSTTRYDIRVYCATEGCWVAGTSSDPAWSKCFNNIDHAVKPGTAQITQTVSTQVVKLQEEDIATNGNYKCDGLAFDCAAAVDGVPTVTTFELAYPFPINLLSASSNVTADHCGNTLDMLFVPDVIIGVTMQLDSSTSDQSVPVPPLAMAGVLPGLTAVVNDQMGQQALGVVATADRNTNTVTFSEEVRRAFDTGSTLTLTYPTRSGALAQLAVPQAAIAVADTAGFVPGLQVTIAGVSVGAVTAVDSVNQVLTLSSPLSAQFAAGGQVAAQFGPVTRGLTSAIQFDVDVATLQIACDTSGIIPGVAVSIQEGELSENLGLVQAVEPGLITVGVAVASSYSIEAMVTFSLTAATTLAAAAPRHTAVDVNAELAAAAVVGVNVDIDGHGVGAVASVVGNTLHLTGSIDSVMPLAAPVTLSMPTFTCVTTDDLLPSRTLDVSPSVVQNAQIGFRMQLTDGQNTDNMGRVVAIDKARNRVTVENEPTRAWPAGTYVEVTRYFIQGVEFGGPGRYDFSGSRNQGSYVDTGRTGRIVYTNRRPTPVRFNMKFEYLH